MKNENDDSRGEFVAPEAVRFVRLLPGPIERVWAYLTEPEKRAKWLAGGPMELRPGGEVELRFNHAELTPHAEPIPEKYGEECAGGVITKGKITRCEPPRLLSHTWSEASGRDSEVTFELTPQGGNVLLVLTHRRLGQDRSLLISVAAGWHTHLGILIDNLRGQAVRPFWSTHSRWESEYERQLAEAVRG